MFALRDGNWKYVPTRGSGGFSQPQARTAKPGEPEGQLDDLARDPTETKNHWVEQRDVVRRLDAKFRELQAGLDPRRLASAGGSAGGHLAVSRLANVGRIAQRKRAFNVTSAVSPLFSATRNVIP